MASVFYSAQAERDLVDLGDYIAERDFDAAEKWVEKILKACDGLKTFPHRSPRFDIRPAMRQLVVGNYLVLYQVNDDIVEIVRIVHGSRHLPDLI